MKVSELSARIGDEAARNIEGALSTLGAKEIAAYAVEGDDGWVAYVATDLGLAVCRPHDAPASRPPVRCDVRPWETVTKATVGFTEWQGGAGGQPFGTGSTTPHISMVDPELHSGATGGNARALTEFANAVNQRALRLV